MSIPAAWPQILDFFGTPLVLEPSRWMLVTWAKALRDHNASCGNQRPRRGAGRESGGTTVADTAGPDRSFLSAP